MTTDQLPPIAPSVHQRVVLFGMDCAFTTTVRDALRAAPGVSLAATVTPGDPTPLDQEDEGCPALRVPDRVGLVGKAFRNSLATVAPDLVVVACFPWRLPAWIRDLAPHGALNVHPSLLPDGRGPDPVFWAFRRDLRETGVTIHVLDAGFDTGPILAQRPVAISGDATIPSLDRHLSVVGADLLLEALPSLRDGLAVAAPQGESGRYAPMPGPDDLVVSTSWTADHAARFIRAVLPVYGPVTVLVDGTGQRLAVAGVIGMDTAAAITGPLSLDGDVARIRFADSILTVRLAMPARPMRLTPAGR